MKSWKVQNFKSWTLIIQMFEDSVGSKLTKLDIIDAGSFYDDDATFGRNEKRIFKPR